jgi:hypothetical protein
MVGVQPSKQLTSRSSYCIVPIRSQSLCNNKQDLSINVIQWRYYILASSASFGIAGRDLEHAQVIRKSVTLGGGRRGLRKTSIEGYENAVGRLLPFIVLDRNVPERYAEVGTA